MEFPGGSAKTGQVKEMYSMKLNWNFQSGGGSGGGVVDGIPGEQREICRDQQRDCCYSTAGHGLVTITLR